MSPRACKKLTIDKNWPSVKIMILHILLNAQYDTFAEPCFCVLQDFTYQEGNSRINVLLQTKTKRHSRQRREVSNIKNVVCIHLSLIFKD